VRDTDSTTQSEPLEAYELHYNITRGSDYRFLGPLSECLCGCDLLHIIGKFEEGLVVYYWTDVVCAACGSILTIRTEIDTP
jgi:hypothetical protein